PHHWECNKHKPPKDNHMKNCDAPENRTTSRIVPMAWATALAAAFAIALPQPAYADDLTPPPVPDKLKVEAGNEVFLVGHGVGTQNYICVPQALASPIRSSRRRPLCSATMRSNSPPTSSAPTRLRTTRIQRWWPLARFGSRGSTRGTRAPFGPN